jgi:hypothetical protein
MKIEDYKNGDKVKVSIRDAKSNLSSVWKDAVVKEIKTIDSNMKYEKSYKVAEVEVMRTYYKSIQCNSMLGDIGEYYDKLNTELILHSSKIKLKQ